MLLNTQALQQAPLGAHGGRTKNQAKGVPLTRALSALEKNSAAKRPFSTAFTLLLPSSVTGEGMVIE